MSWIIGVILIAVMGLGAASPAFIDRAIEKNIRERYGPFESLRVAVDTDFLKALRGEVRGIDIQAKGFQVKDIPVSEARFKTKSLYYDAWSTLRGTPRWSHEIETSAAATFSEASLNLLIAKPMVQEKLKGIRVNLPMAETADIENLKVRLLDRKFVAQGSLELGTGFPIPFQVSGVPLVREGKIFASEVQLAVMGMPLAPSLYEESLKKPLSLPPSPDLKYRLDGVTISSGSVQLLGTVWLPPKK